MGHCGAVAAYWFDLSICIAFGLGILFTDVPYNCSSIKGVNDASHATAAPVTPTLYRCCHSVQSGTMFQSAAVADCLLRSVNCFFVHKLQQASDDHMKTTKDGHASSII
ncbi:hypothetical protein BC835DRAFT_512505 [Cytidiella melzeri]|nr:hypothetical protein BC835DRAFT_512505 [Cytidiella melzeri]